MTGPGFVDVRVDGFGRFAVAALALVLLAATVAINPMAVGAQDEPALPDSVSGQLLLVDTTTAEPGFIKIQAVASQNRAVVTVTDEQPSAPRDQIEGTVLDFAGNVSAPWTNGSPAMSGEFPYAGATGERHVCLQVQDPETELWFTVDCQPVDFSLSVGEGPLSKLDYDGDMQFTQEFSGELGGDWCPDEYAEHETGCADPANAPGALFGTITDNGVPVDGLICLNDVCDDFESEYILELPSGTQTLIVAPAGLGVNDGTELTVEVPVASFLEFDIELNENFGEPNPLPDIPGELVLVNSDDAEDGYVKIQAAALTDAGAAVVTITNDRPNDVVTVDGALAGLVEELWLPNVVLLTNSAPAWAAGYGTYLSGEFPVESTGLKYVCLRATSDPEIQNIWQTVECETIELTNAAEPGSPQKRDLDGDMEFTHQGRPLSFGPGEDWCDGDFGDNETGCSVPESAQGAVFGTMTQDGEPVSGRVCAIFPIGGPACPQIFDDGTFTLQLNSGMADLNFFPEGVSAEIRSEDGTLVSVNVPVADFVEFNIELNTDEDEDEEEGEPAVSPDISGEIFLASTEYAADGYIKIQAAASSGDGAAALARVTITDELPNDVVVVEGSLPDAVGTLLPAFVALEFNGSAPPWSTDHDTYISGEFASLGEPGPKFVCVRVLQYGTSDTWQTARCELIEVSTAAPDESNPNYDWDGDMQFTHAGEPFLDAIGEDWCPSEYAANETGCADAANAGGAVVGVATLNGERSIEVVVCADIDDERECASSFNGQYELGLPAGDYELTALIVNGPDEAPGLPMFEQVTVPVAGLVEIDFEFGTSNPPATGVSFVVHAAGDTGDEELEVRVGGDVIGTVEMSTSFADYEFEMPADTAIGDIQVAFVNDARRSGYDRNVEVDWVQLGNVRFETEAEETVSTGTYNRSTGCAESNNTLSETLHCNGYFVYGGDGTPGNGDEPGNGDMPGNGGFEVEFTIRAAGDTGDELLELHVGDSVFGPFDVSTFFTTWEVYLPAGTELNDVRVVFINDARRSGYDRNLEIDWIEFDGVRYDTAAEMTVSTGTYNSDTGCAESNNTVSETLHCNGYFVYAGAGDPPPVVDPPPAGDGLSFVVRAEGQTGDEEFEVRVDGVVVAEFEATASFADYEVEFPAGTSIRAVEVAFTNDARRSDYDRNLEVDYVELDGVRFETEAESTFSTGTYNRATRCDGSNVTTSQTLHCNGSFVYDSFDAAI